MKLKKLTMTIKADGKRVVFPSISIVKTGFYEREGVLLNVRPLHKGHVYLEAKSDNKKLEEVEYRVSLPLLNFGKVLIPDSGRFYMHKFLPSTIWFQKFELQTRAIGNPFLVLMDLTDKPVFAFGLLGKLIETTFEVTSPGINRKNSLWVKRGRFIFKVRKKIRGKILKDGLFILNNALTWWHALREYGITYQSTRDNNGDFSPERLHNIEKDWKSRFHITHRAFYPAFCTWLVTNSDNMNHDWVIKMGSRVKELGMEAFILDDGWYGTGLDSFKPGMDIGDWPCKVEGKFENLPKTLSDLKNMGLNPVLWFAPLAVGKDSKIFPEVKHLLVTHRGQLYTCPAGFHTLCIRNPEARKIILNHVERLLKCGAGGLKVDLFDYMSTEPCDANHYHDVETIAEAMEILLKDIQKKAIEIDPDALISVTNNHANVHLVVYSSCVRGGDSPYDPNMLIYRSIYPAAYTPVVHNDYALWTGYESPIGIAHIMIRQIFAGIPNFTIDFLNSPDEQNRVVKAWLAFFKRIKHIYINGEFYPQNPSLTVWVRTHRKETMITVLPPSQEIELPEDFDTVYILNGTSENYLRILNPQANVEAEVYDHLITLKDKKEIQKIIPVYEAGLTILRKKEALQ